MGITPEEAHPTQQPDETVDYIPFDEFSDLEDVYRYCEGGFHPVHLGDVLDGRFEVVHKLGHGGFGIAWLCLDKTESKRWRAIKILAADHSFSTRGGGADIATARYLHSRASAAELERNHVAPAAGSFWLEGPNGQHLCLVMEVLGVTAAWWCRGLNPTDPGTPVAIKDVCRQITRGVRFLHAHGVCHGDLRPPNVLVRLRGLDELDKEGLLALVGDGTEKGEEPRRAPVEVAEGSPDPGDRAPRYCVRPTPHRFEPLCTGEVAIIDFGESFRIDLAPRATGIPMAFAAPENLLEGGVGPPSDVWSLACTIYALRTDGDLFMQLAGFSRLVMQDVRAWEYYLEPLAEPYRTLFIQTRMKGRRAKGNAEAAVADHQQQLSKEEEGERPGLELSGQGEGELKPVAWSPEALSKLRQDTVGESAYSDVLEADLGVVRSIVRTEPDKPFFSLSEYSFSRDEVRCPSSRTC